jgi:hypothetical protein
MDIREKLLEVGPDLSSHRVSSHSPSMGRLDLLDDKGTDMEFHEFWSAIWIWDGLDAHNGYNPFSYRPAV